MTWRTMTDDELKMARRVRDWIEVARKWGRFGYGAMWLPTDADISKSALLERMMGGKNPLEFPPPVGYSCPWYALVEDSGPHYVGQTGDVCFGDFAGPDFKEDPDGKEVLLLQNRYEIVERRGPRASIATVEPQDFLLADIRHETPYRFRLWYDAKHELHSGRTGGWLMQNASFQK